MNTRMSGAVAFLLIMFAASAFAQAIAPKLELAFEADVDVGAPEDVGSVPGGTRRLIPINGGAFSGPLLKGRILPGGADHQLLQPEQRWKLLRRSCNG